MIARYLLANPLILFLSMLVISVAGVVSLSTLPRLEDPELTRRVGIVTVTYPGAEAEKVESLVSVVLEDALAGLQGVHEFRSNSRNDVCQFVIELRDDIDDVESIWALVRDRIEEAKTRLPKQSQVAPLSVVPLKAFSAIISLRDANRFSIVSEAVRSTAKSLQSELASIDGTELVDVVGLPELEYVIRVAPESLIERGLSVGLLARQIADQLDAPPIGMLRERSSELGIDFASGRDGATDLGEILVRGQPNGGDLANQPTKVDDIATIEKIAVEPPRESVLSDGQRSVVVCAMMEPDHDITKWSQRVNLQLAQLAKESESEVEIDLIFSQADHVQSRMNDLAKNLALGMLSVVVVVLIMMGWRCMIVVSVALPLAALMVLSGMNLLSIPIHQISVTGLIVALGLLIDNAIIIVDEIAKRRGRGADSETAVAQSVRHLAIPLAGSTVTTALAFLPIAMLSGPAGEFVGTIAISVILAIGSSFFLAMTIIPALMGWVEIDDWKSPWLSSGIRIGFVARIYESLLGWLLRFPIVGVLTALILPGLGLWLANRLPVQFFPPSDRTQIQVEVEQSADATITQTSEVVMQIQDLVAEHPDVWRQHWFVGRSAPTFYYNLLPRRRNSPFYAQAIVDLHERAATEQVALTLQDRLNQTVTSARVVVRQFEQGPPFEAPIEIRVVGDDLRALQTLGGQVRAVLSADANVTSTRADMSETVPRLSLEIDDLAAADAGIDRTQIANALYTSLNGANAGEIFESGASLPVRVRLTASNGSPLQTALAMPIEGPSQAGSRNIDRITSQMDTNLPSAVGQFVDVRIDASVGSIVRIDGQRVNEIKAFVRAGVLPSEVLESFQRRLEQSGFAVPKGYRVEFGGEDEERSEAVARLIGNGIVLFAIMAVALIIATGSLRSALIISAVGGLAAATAPLLLAIFGFPFGFMAILGTMGLVGVAVNDSIVVLTALRESEVAGGRSHRYRVKTLMHSTRHVLSTTFTTIVGFLPLMLAGGGFWPPLAVTVAGGVAFATVLALGFAPCSYVLLHAAGNQRSDKTNADDG